MKSINFDEFDNTKEEDVSYVFLELIRDGFVKPLYESMKKNSKVFSFVSERQYETMVGLPNENCKRVDSIVKKQMSDCNDLILRLERCLKTISLTEYAKYVVVNMIRPIKDLAIQYGYNEQAKGFLKLIKNEELFGKNGSSTDISKDVLKIMENYGKRQILEGESMADDANQLIADVVSGEYGQDTRKLSADSMEQAYKGATIVKGEVVFKTDGTHQRVKGK